MENKTFSFQFFLLKTLKTVLCNLDVGFGFSFWALGFGLLVPKTADGDGRLGLVLCFAFAWFLSTMVFW